MNIFIGIVVGLIVLTFLVIIHEAGHFIAARRNGVNVLEFGIGFPPRAIAWIKDPKTHKWRKLRKDEWDKVGIMKTVIESGKVGEARAEKEKKNNTEKEKQNNTEKEAHTKETSDKHTNKDRTTESKVTRKALVTVKNREKLIADGLVFSINWLPIGGFCQMDGESAEDERKGTFGAASFWSKTKILFAGVAMNWLAAFVIFTVLAWTGMPSFLDHQFTVEADTRIEQVPVQVKEVIEGSPADQAGFLQGDYILEVNGEKVGYGSEIISLNQEHAGQEVTYKIRRAADGDSQCDQAPCDNATTEETEITATLNSEDAEYLLGVNMQSSESLAYSTWSAPLVGAGLTAQITGETFRGLGELLWNLISGTGRLFSFDAGVRESGQAAISAAGDSVSGPVGIIGVLFPSFTAAGPSNLAFLTALISVSLACMNVLPIPALDGGRWLLIGIYKLRRKKLTKEAEQRIVSRAMFILLALMAVVTILDIARFF